VGDRPEAERVHDGERPRTHGKDVAQDAADASSGALKRLDERWVVVRLDFESARPTITNVDDARIFAGALHHAAAARRQPLQVRARRFVGAVLAPHHAENAELGERRLAAQRLQDALVFLGRDAVLAQQFGSDSGVVGVTGSSLYLVHGGEETL